MIFAREKGEAKKKCGWENGRTSFLCGKRGRREAFYMVVGKVLFLGGGGGELHNKTSLGRKRSEYMREKGGRGGTLLLPFDQGVWGKGEQPARVRSHSPDKGKRKKGRGGK